MSFKEKSSKYLTDMADYAILGVAAVAGFAGAPGIAIAGVAIYLAGAKVFSRR